MSAIASGSTVECGFSLRNLIMDDHIRSTNIHILETTKRIRYKSLQFVQIRLIVS